VKNNTIKRRYLIQTPKDVVRCILTTFPLYKHNLHQLYIENKQPFCEKLGVLAARFSSIEEQDAFEKDLASFILSNVTADKRYKNRYLSLFGLPQNYDFSVQDVFARCDQLGTKALELSLLGGMSTQKVLKVLMYHALYCLEKAIEDLLDDGANAPKTISKTAYEMLSLVRCSQCIFDHTLIASFTQALNPLVSKNRETLLRCVQSTSYQTLLLDMRFFLKEESEFYLLKKSEMPLLFFVKKKLKKEDSKIAQKLKKALP